MAKYWAVARPHGEHEEPHYLGPFDTETLAREGQDTLTEDFHHLETGRGWAFYVVKRPLAWRP